MKSRECENVMDVRKHIKKHTYILIANIKLLGIAHIHKRMFQNTFVVVAFMSFVCMQQYLFFIVLLSINDPGQGLSGDKFPVQDYMMLGQDVGPRSRMEMRL